MAMIKCPECGQEISDTSDKCIKCGYPIKSKKKVNKKLVGGILVFIVLAIIIVCTISVINKKTKHPDLMKVLNCSYVEDAKELLGDDYEFASSPTARFYSYTDLELDGVVYDTVYITELKSDGSLYEIGFEFSVEDLDVIDEYVKDISKSYGTCKESSNSYRWTTAKTLNPRISVQGKNSPYSVLMSLN